MARKVLKTVAVAEILRGQELIERPTKGAELRPMRVLESVLLLTIRISTLDQTFNVNITANKGFWRCS